MVLLESEQVPLKSPAPDFHLRGVDGEFRSLADYAEANVLVIVFMCNHCPYVQAQWSKLTELQAKYKDRGVRFVGINSNINPDYPEDSYEKMKQYYEQYQMNFDYLCDAEQEVARNYKAQCTPDIFVYGKDRLLAYHGRVDDARSPGEKATTHELDDAIQALLKGEMPLHDRHPSMGCSIKWK